MLVIPVILCSKAHFIMHGVLRFLSSWHIVKCWKAIVFSDFALVNIMYLFLTNMVQPLLLEWTSALLLKCLKVHILKVRILKCSIQSYISTCTWLVKHFHCSYQHMLTCRIAQRRSSLLSCSEEFTAICVILMKRWNVFSLFLVKII